MERRWGSNLTARAGLFCARSKDLSVRADVYACVPGEFVCVREQSV